MMLEEEMAVAVLRGDRVAACALADLLIQTYVDGGRQYPPVTRVTFPIDRLRVIVYVSADADVEINQEELNIAVARWVRGEAPLGLVGVERVELYEFPESGTTCREYERRTERDVEKN